MVWVAYGASGRDMRHSKGESLALHTGAEAPWLQGNGQLKCLFMSVGQRGETVAMFSSYMKGPECSNEL